MDTMQLRVSRTLLFTIVSVFFVNVDIILQMWCVVDIMIAKPPNRFLFQAVSMAPHDSIDNISVNVFDFN